MNNKEKIAIITDSCADLPKSLIKKHNIFVIPLKVFIDGRQYSDGVDIGCENICRKLASAEKFGTSLPDGEVIERTFKKIKEQGYEKAIVITISSRLSGTYNMLEINRDICKGLEVRIIDSKNCSLGQGMIVLQLAEHMEQGLEWGELLVKAVSLCKSTHSFLCADTLDYLQKGGRIGRITAFTGTMLNIKPIMTLNEAGELYPITKARGRKQAAEKIIELLKNEAKAGKGYNLSAIHAGNTREFFTLTEQIEKALPDYSGYWKGLAGAAVTVHLGPGVIAAAIQILE